MLLKSAGGLRFFHSGEIIMSTDFIVRIMGMLVLGVSGVYLGISFATSLLLTSAEITFYALLFGLIGALVGLVLSPYMTTRPARTMRRALAQVDAQTLVAGLIGLIVGLAVAALLAFPISLLPAPVGEILPFIGAMFLSYFGVTVFVMRQHDIFSILFSRLPRLSYDDSETDHLPARMILMDTSVIIDGRIADIARTGFLTGTLLVPNFVLNELQYIADSPDGLRRQRGRRGMEILSKLQKEPTIPTEISDINVESAHEVDDKLVILARQLKCPILTNDYNLNRVAEIQGVTVLNINELANAVKAILLPGETLQVNVIQEGKEAGQGVGYLDDGTMVVVEDGVRHIRSNIPVTVTKVLQTTAGRMIFARPEEITS
jgi:uncharacterized protein YacL